MRPHTMFDSEPKSSKLKQVADQFFDIAKQYMGLMIPLDGRSDAGRLRGHVVARSTPDARHHSDLIRRDADAVHVRVCGAHECPDATASMSHPRPLCRAPRP
jgi:hypothetical protein